MVSKGYSYDCLQENKQDLQSSFLAFHYRRKPDLLLVYKARH